LADGTQLERAPKTAAGQRTIALPPHIIPVLQAHLTEQGVGTPLAFVFTDDQGRPLSHRRWNYRWDKARTAAGLPAVHFHDLRHAALTLLAQSGATLAELMSHAGHASSAAAISYQRVAEGRADVLAERLSAAWAYTG
jgi:integrase